MAAEGRGAMWDRVILVGAAASIGLALFAISDRNWNAAVAEATVSALLFARWAAHHGR